VLDQLRQRDGINTPLLPHFILLPQLMRCLVLRLVNKNLYMRWVQTLERRDIILDGHRSYDFTGFKVYYEKKKIAPLCTPL
jgi:hypothetical protein